MGHKVAGAGVRGGDGIEPSEIRPYAACRVGLVTHVAMLGLMAALVVHDLWTRRRIHLATILGLVFYQGVNVAFQMSGVGPAIVTYRRAHL